MLYKITTHEAGFYLPKVQCQRNIVGVYKPNGGFHKVESVYSMAWCNIV